jgi:replication factor C subunit 1
VRAPTLPASTAAASNINSGTAAAGAGSGGDADALWVDKYRPQSSAAMIGSTEIVSKLTAWLRRWDAVHLHKTEKVPFSKENPGARAALLSGPPGIGKSTVAALAAKEGGYDVSLSTWCKLDWQPCACVLAFRIPSLDRTELLFFCAFCFCRCWS